MKEQQKKLLIEMMEADEKDGLYKTNNMTKEEIKFLVDNKINFESVKMGFTRNIPFQVLEGYEAIYRKYQDPQFVLTYWCGGCVFDMMERLIRFCEQDREYNLAYKGLEETILIKGEVVEKPKRGRPKK